MQVIAITVLLIVANGAPVLTARLLGSVANWPVDRGRVLADGARLFGATKTWRGIVAALCLTPLSALAVGVPWTVGVVVGAGAMIGDLLSSYSKRRLGMASSARAVGLDQLPESLIPALFLHIAFDYGWPPLIGAVVLFGVADVALSPLLFRWGLRRAPH
ncbi:CDP-archaeol synthase [Gilvimarinus sp. F26214L]|uniref:CDP-archaeol synthase n=1 Tax=Gilvimarinus sp. DZF01 TaxID=3461371 RepID=UPI0040466F5F